MTATPVQPADTQLPAPAGADGRRPIKRALISVYDKTDLTSVASALVDAGVEIVSTGSTAKAIAGAGLPVTQVEELTGFPECLDGRVKTLHPKVHAGLLADLRLASHREQLEELNVQPFELLISNLYPFTATVATGATADECIEQIDIGGPAMVRSSAKNHPSVAVLTSPDQYGLLRQALTDGGFTLEQRKALAAAAFVHTASYDVAVAGWMGSVLTGSDLGSETDAGAGSGFPSWLGATWDRAAVLRYGENPHQQAALYRSAGLSGTADSSGAGGTLADATQLHGKEMSYNNYIDANAARRAAGDFDAPAVAIIKHANPCGIAVGSDIAEAHRKAHACDPVSAFGGVIAANRPVSVQMAQQISDVFTEVVLAPGYEDGAVDILAAKKNIRLLVVGDYVRGGMETRPIDGGLLVQTVDVVDADHDRAANWQLVSGEPASPEVLADLEFAWQAIRSVKSNAILLASDGASVGVGMGQVNRVDSSRLAVDRAGDRVKGSVAASDAFFPFPDGLEILLAAGVSAVVQPGGSVRDDAVIAAAQEAGATMYFTGARHFFH
jgi:phosphoribosylaminoimidazolecarboxamide formyltransferase/IMP cyclohydrolase